VSVGFVTAFLGLNRNGYARSTAAAYCGDGAESTTDGTSCDCAKRGAVIATACVRNAANTAMRTPTASPARVADTGSRFRAAFTPTTTAPIAPIASARAMRSAALMLFVSVDVTSTTVTEGRPRTPHRIMSGP
jgi:hypothetical protein